MKLNDYAKDIAKEANVNNAQAQRVMQALFADVKRRLNSNQDVTLPTLGRLVNQDRPNGRRVILARAGSPEASKTKPDAGAKKAAQTK